MPIQSLKIARAVAGCLAGLAMGFGFFAGPAAEAASPNHITIWVPDFFGGKVYVDRIDNTVAPPSFSQEIIHVSGRFCHPNSVVIRKTELYVVCTDFCISVFCGTNQILVYNTATHAFKKIDGVGIDHWDYFPPEAGLIGGVFDKRGNLWVSLSPPDPNNHKPLLNVLLRVPSGQLAKTRPLIDRVVTHSPDSPAGLSLDPTDGSLWVVGQFDAGIVVNFEDAVINQPRTFLHGNPLNPAPRYCISNTAGDCRQKVTAQFNSPEGVAVFQGSVWVSNNGGTKPGKTLVRLRLVKHPTTPPTLMPSVFGTVGRPFSCPGGMFAAGLPGAPPNTLWVNDEGYGDADTDCGSSKAEDQGDQIGQVLEFRPGDLFQHQGSPTPEHFPNWTRIRTSSPGFGGIFVQMD
jgi:hypothetical protein